MDDRLAIQSLSLYRCRCSCAWRTSAGGSGNSKPNAFDNPNRHPNPNCYIAADGNANPEAHANPGC